MKANGKNLKMFVFETHHYMDMYPETEFMTRESQAVANGFIHQMRSNWASGTVSDAKEVTPEEFFKARQSNYWNGCEDLLDNLALDCTQEWVDIYSELLSSINN
jgi:hypothetical protein